MKDVDGNFQVHKSQARIYVDCEGEYDYEDTVEHLQRVFGLVAVSYTHLDVYKRQRWGFLLLRRNAMEAENIR